jgi:hypothetical protein
MQIGFTVRVEGCFVPVSKNHLTFVEGMSSREHDYQERIKEAEGNPAAKA